MNDDTIQDLKQFIAATISQQTADMATKEDIANLATKADIANMATKTDIANLDKKLSSKIEDLSNSVAEALEGSNESTDEQLKNYDQRIAKLEQKAA